MSFLWTPAGGTTLTLGPPTYRVVNISGLGSDSLLHTAKLPAQDGSTIIHQYFAERDIGIDLAILDGSSLQDTYNARRDLMQAFNARKGLGVLTWEQSGVSYAIECLTRSVQLPVAKETTAPGLQRAFVEVYAPNPFFFSTEQTLSTSTATNDGDVAAPVEIVFNGPVTNPAAINSTTGKRIEVDATIDSGDTLRVQTGWEVEVILTVDGVESNALHLLTSGSEFWKLETGDNTIAYEVNGSPGTLADMSLKWRNWFIGV